MGPIGECREQARTLRPEMLGLRLVVSVTLVLVWLVTTGVTEAQQAAKVARIGWLGLDPDSAPHLRAAFMSYSADNIELARRAAIYIDRILKGAKPADLPVEQAAKYELVMNLKTAKALGITIPPPVLLRADQLIE